MSIEQRYAIAFLHRKGLSGEAIHDELVMVYKGDAYSLDSVYKWIHHIILGRENLHDRPSIQILSDPTITDAVQHMVEMDPLISARMIAKILGISPNTVIDRLKILGYKCFHTRWVPHKLTKDQKKIRLQFSKPMLDILQQEKKTNFCNIITGDESWFIYEYTQNTQWVLSKEELLTKVVKTNMQKKKMVTIFFNGKGLVTINFKPKDTKYNSDYFINIIDNVYNEVYPKGFKKHAPKKFIHFDNARVHTSQKVVDYIDNSGFNRMPHPPYSPDLAPSDFGLFGTIKKKMEGKPHNTEQELENHIIEIIDNFKPKFWEKLFMDWIKRLENLKTTNGDYLS